MLKINDNVRTKLSIVREIARESHHSGIGKMVLVRCECGEELERLYSYVKRGRVTMCRQCQSKKHSDDISKIAKSKGIGNKRLMSIWNNMKTRCYNSKSKSYANHGARGITVCDKWKNNRREFEEWALANGYSDGLSIDRINNDGNYEPDNCRWTTSREQALNSRIRVDSLTGERCVTPLRGKFQLTIDGKYIGVYKSVNEAVAERERILDDKRIR